MTIINLTPHPINLYADAVDGLITGFTGFGPAAKEGRFALVATLPPSGVVARAAQRDERVGAVEVGSGVSVEVVTTSYGAPTDLPPPEAGKYLVVSVLTAQAAKAVGRSTSDLLITTDPVRDAAGKIIGCRKFAVI